LKTNINKTFVFAKQNPAIFTRIVLVFLTFFGLLSYLSINALALSDQNDSMDYNAGLSQKTSYIQVPTLNVEDITIAQQRKDKEEKRQAEIQKQLKIRQGHIDRINKFLSKKRSPVANTKIAEIIYDKSKAAGADYRGVLAILGVESGFCAADFHYNCFGYLNGVHYENYEQAFSKLVPRVSREYAAKYGTNFVALAKAYGMINWQAGAANLSMYFKQV